MDKKARLDFRRDLFEDPELYQEYPKLRAFLHSVMDTCDELESEKNRLSDLINTPQVDEFFKAMRIEAAHQRERWTEEHDKSKTHADWFWLIGWLGGKAVHNPMPHNEPGKKKRLHRIITVAAAAFNWWRAVRDNRN